MFAFLKYRVSRGFILLAVGESPQKLKGGKIWLIQNRRLWHRMPPPVLTPLDARQTEVQPTIRVAQVAKFANSTKKIVATPAISNKVAVIDYKE